MRIVGGNLKGKKLQSPTDDRTRPTSDRTREALFSILSASLIKKGRNWTNISFLDVFSGTGAIGLEALSRGAHKVQFIENYPPALECLRKNVADHENAFVLSVDATCPPFSTQAVDIIFMDAPYREELWEKALNSLKEKGWIDKKTLIIIEIDKKEEGLVPEDFKKIDDRTYGRNRLLFCQLSKNGRNHVFGR